ncbi:MAG: hypothetical protein ABUL58_02190 [Steroidobacter sp.]
MSATSKFRQELQASLVAKGFECDKRDAPRCICFRREVGDVMQLLALNWEKSGKPRFVALFGVASAGGVKYHGSIVEAKNLLIEHSSILGFLAPKSHTTTRGWFRLDRPLISRILFRPKYYSEQEVIAEFLKLFEEIEIYWANGILGKHMNIPSIERKWVENAV